MPGFSSNDTVRASVLSGTGVVACKAGVLGSAGVARDTELFGVRVAKNAGPATLTITGLADQNGNAQSLVINGSTAQDWIEYFPWPLLNEAGAFTFQASVTLTCWLYLRAYNGP